MATYPVFSVNEVLTSDDMNAVGLWLIKSQTVGTSVASVEVTSAFSSDYANYRIVINNVQGSTGADLRLTFGSTVTGYYYGGHKVTYGGVASVFSGSNAAYMIVGTTEGSGSGGEQGLAFDVFSPNLTVRTTVFAGGFGSGATSYSGGMLADTTAYTSFKITPSGGSLTGGTIKVYGYRN